MAPTLTIKILGDAASASRALQQTGAEAESMAGRVNRVSSNMTGPALAAAGAIGVAGMAAVKAASDQEQAVGALEAVFKGNSAAMLENAAAASKMGLSTAQYAQQAAVLGASLASQGIQQQQLAGTTDTLITAAADMAAQFGGSTADAVSALTSLMRGETDPIERFGVSIKQSQVSAYAMANGMSEAEAKTALLFEQLKNSGTIGAAAREADTLSGSTQAMQAEMANASAEIGDALLPWMVKLTGVVRNATKFVSEHQGAVMVLVGALGVAAAAVLAVNAATRVYAAAQAIIRGATIAWTAVQWALNVALTANPIGLIVAAIAALVAGVVLAYTKFDAFRKIVDAVWGAIKTAIKWIGDLIGKLGNLHFPKLPSWLPGVNMAPPPGAAGNTLGVSTRASSSSGGITIVNNFNGLVTDPEATARAIRRSLTASDRRSRTAPQASFAW